MGSFRTILASSVVMAALAAVSWAEPAEESAASSLEQLVQRVRRSVVDVSFSGRDREGMGTGFVIDPSGLVATNLHVLGLGRPITVRTTDGKELAVTFVHASDRKLDLAILKVEAQDLAALPLAGLEEVRPGKEVVAIGNPLGLRHSVVKGVVSGMREIEGISMIQMAIPIERGNSGGPLVDMEGRVVGVVTLKSMLTANLGFAMPAGALRSLLNRPNPIAMRHWLNIGLLDPQHWTTLFGADWRQRPGRILVDGAGTGFGGRSLCLASAPPPDPPYELAVSVRLADESGAAGLVFQSDGQHRHYGFYPSGGQLRLTRFAGPDVFSWKILAQIPTPHYRPGQWNTLKVRVEKGRMACYVNDQLVVTESNDELAFGKVGLAKFRDTEAEFRDFRVAKEIPPTGPSPESIARVSELIESVPFPAPGRHWPAELLETLQPQGTAGRLVLRDRARQLERQAEQLRELAQAAHEQEAIAELGRCRETDEARLDLVRASLWIAKLDKEDLDVESYSKEFERLAGALAQGVAGVADESARLAALDRFLFAEQGFHGNRTDYYSRNNSYLDEVLEDRTGLPITLAVLYMELARRIGVAVEGVPLPGHFVVRHVPAGGGRGQLIDVFDGGRRLSREDADQKVREITGQPLHDEHLAPASKRDILGRILRNLKGIAIQSGTREEALRYFHAILALDPESVEERLGRAILLYQTDRPADALEDVDWLLEHRPPEIDLDRIRELRERLVQGE